jgi:hypothetical protein
MDVCDIESPPGGRQMAWPIPAGKHVIALPTVHPPRR